MVATLFKSAFADLEVPSTDLASFIFNGAKRHDGFVRSDSPRAVFVDDSDADAESLTLSQMEVFCSQLASGLYHTIGVRSGDVVAIIMPNSIYYTAIVLASMMTGASCTLANPAYTVRELHHQLEDSKVNYVITTTGMLPLVCEAVGRESQPVRHLLVVDKQAPDADVLPVSSVFDILCDAEFPRLALQTENECASTMALILYSSGTTGAPKGVMLSHRNLVACVLQSEVVTHDLASGDEVPGTMLAIVPMFHTFGITFQCLLGPYKGVTTVVMTKFEMTKLMQLIEAHSVTDTILAPPIINALVKMPAAATTERYNMTSLKRAIVGGAPLGNEIIEMMEARMPDLRIAQGYGMTEMSPTVAVNPPAARRLESVGALAPSIEVRVLDSDNKLVGCGETGELCFRGPNVMMGYLGNLEATRETFDEDGFLHTGDIGHIDSGIYVYITGRKKELIKFNGFQVAPAELEALLMQHPRVKDCAVAGVFDDARHTEVPKAYLVLNAEEADTDAQHKIASEVVEWLNSQVAYYKKLRGGYALLDAVPKNASGKILRRLLY